MGYRAETQCDVWFPGFATKHMVLSVGSNVVFELAFNSKGQAQALNVQEGDAMTAQLLNSQSLYGNLPSLQDGAADGLTGLGTQIQSMPQLGGTAPTTMDQQS